MTQGQRSRENAPIPPGATCPVVPAWDHSTVSAFQPPKLPCSLSISKHPGDSASSQWLSSKVYFTLVIRSISCLQLNILSDKTGLPLRCCLTRKGRLLSLCDIQATVSWGISDALHFDKAPYQIGYKPHFQGKEN